MNPRNVSERENCAVSHLPIRVGRPTEAYVLDPPPVRVMKCEPQHCFDTREPIRARESLQRFIALDRRQRSIYPLDPFTRQPA